MERHVPKIVGPWLAGLYDRDRVVARAANDGLSSFLTTPEKLISFWLKCQSQILDFATEGIRDTQDTLSDERSTTAEDAEAKYFRVVTSSLSLVLGLLQRVDDAGMQKCADKYDEYFGEEAVWKSITFKDSAVRKTVCQLLFACLDRQLPYGSTAKARQAFVTGGLKTSQASSALEYVKALTKLTQQDSSFWISSSTDKRPPITRLQTFISKGSQGSPPKFWEALDQLLAIIPVDALGLESSSKLLSSIKAGITNREEPRTNTSYSWKCFSDFARRSVRQLPEDDKLAFVQDHLFPLFEQFLFSTSENHAIPMGPNAMTIFVDLHMAIIQSSSKIGEASATEWERLSAVLCTNISGSLPEVSKEYKSSQTNIGEQGRRWFGLVGQIFAKLKHGGANLPDQTSGPSNKVLTQSCRLLESRNMKPFGAAQIIEYALSTSKHLFLGDNGQHLASFLLEAADDGFDKLAEASSARYLLSALGIFGSIEGQAQAYEKIWGAWVDAALKLQGSEQARNATLAGLLSQGKAASLATENASLQDTIHTQALATVTGESNVWDFVEAACVHHALSNDAARKLGADLVALLAKQTSNSGLVLRMLELIAKSQPSVFLEEPIHTELVAELLALSEINESTISSKVASIRSLLSGQSHGQLPLVDIIQSSLEKAGPQSLGWVATTGISISVNITDNINSIRTLVSQARTAIDNDTASWEDILPSTNLWMGHFAPLLDAPINPSLSITSNIGGAVSLPHRTNAENTAAQVPRDRDGRSIPARMALYTCELIKDDFASLSLPAQFRIELLYLQGLAVQLASDQITAMSRYGLWLSLEQAGVLSEAEELVSSSRHMLNEIVNKATDWQSPTETGDSESSIIRGLVDLAMKESRDMSPRGVYSARVLSELLQALSEAHGLPSSVEEQFLNRDNLRASPGTALLASGLVSGLGEVAQSSKAVNNFCNRLVSDAAEVTLDGKETGVVLELLATVGQIYETGELPVAANRIVFAVKQITSWLEHPSEINSSLSASICRALNVLLPSMKEVYGSYWEDTLQFCAGLWERAAHFDIDEVLPFIHASMKLVKTLEGISEPNDDLEDALREFAPARSAGLVELLRLDRGANSQPLEIVDALLCREVEKIPVSRIPEPEDLFGLVVSESRDIQTAAFNLLHRKIPANQEQKSIDALLDKTGVHKPNTKFRDVANKPQDARLPDELLSLFLDPPTLEKFPDELLSLFPSSIRAYLLSWKLVFDAYASSSFKVRTDFTEHLRAENLVDPLLDFMFDVLGHSAAHPLNLDKENIGPQQICDYNIKLAEAGTGEESLHWFLVHLYYLTLKFIPGLFRTWYIGCRSKQTRIAVESWTAKYLSPIIIDETLDSVQTWSEHQETPAADEQELLIKVSKSAKEITAGYEVDEAQAAIVIKLPPSYPIESVTVSSHTRVAVNERKWQSWIMITQGVITFSNGSIIDGLQVFRRNIIGALKGQSECAICYSIISTDKRVPDKRCQTCKNLFHRGCLYKWFQTSNQNTCPLCRNPVDYLGSDVQKRRHG